MRESLCVEDRSALFTGSTEGRGRMVKISVFSHLTAVLSHTPPVEMSEDAIFPAKWKVREHNGIGAKKLERVKEGLNALYCKFAMLLLYVSADLAPLQYWTLGQGGLDSQDTKLTSLSTLGKV